MRELSSDGSGSGARGCSAMLASELDDARARERLCVCAITTAYFASNSGHGGGGWNASSCHASVWIESMSWVTLNLMDSSDAISGGGPPRLAGRVGGEFAVGCCVVPSWFGVVMISSEDNVPGGAGDITIRVLEFTCLYPSLTPLPLPCLGPRTHVMTSTTSQAQEKRPVSVDDDVDDLDGAEIQRLED